MSHPPPQPQPRAPILTARLRLEPVRASDAAAAQAVIDISRDELFPWFGWVRDATVETTLRYWAQNQAEWDAGTAYHFTVFLGDELIGSIGLRLHPAYPYEADFGYWMGTPWAGHGYMSEAAVAVRDFGFDQVGLRRQELGAGSENLGSQRIAEKLGMRREGMMRGSAWNGAGEPYDAWLYGMLRDDPRRDTGPAYAGERAVPAISEPDFARASDVSGGLVTAVAQDESGEVLMVAQMNEEAYRRTLDTGHAWFWSRSRERLWEKGETSGNYLDVRAVTLDCDGDAVLLRVTPHGPACHTGARSCFHNPVR